MMREPLAKLMSERFVLAPVDPNHLACMTGVSAILNALFYALCEKGDAVRR